MAPAQRGRSTAEPLDAAEHGSIAQRRRPIVEALHLTISVASLQEVLSSDLDAPPTKALLRKTTLPAAFTRTKVSNSQLPINFDRWHPS